MKIKIYLYIITWLQIKDIKLYYTSILEKDLVDNKIGVLDIRVIANEINNIDIKMQVVRSAYIADRILWCCSKIYCGYLKEWIAQVRK